MTGKPWEAWKTEAKAKNASNDAVKSVGVGAGVGVAIMALIRLAGVPVPWGPGGDAAAVGAIATIAAKVGTYWKSYKRDKQKHGGFGLKGSGAGFPPWNFLAVSLIAASVVVASFGGLGCVTTNKPDGSSVVEVDIDATVALIAVALDSARETYALYAEYVAQNNLQEQAESVAQMQEFAGRVQILADLLDRTKTEQKRLKGGGS